MRNLSKVMGSLLKRIVKSLLAFVADEHCALCNEPLEVGECVVCRECVVKENLFETFQLQVPGNPIERRLHGTGITAAAALMNYQQGEVSQRLIHELKYKGRKEIANVLGEGIASKVANSQRYEGIDCVVPVPIHENKLKQRGFNQSELIAEKVAERMNVPLVADQVWRLSDNKAQAGMDIVERQKTEIEFRVKDERFFEGKKVLLIDDVFTTGTTVANCARAFERIEGIEMVVFAAASPLGR